MCANYKPPSIETLARWAGRPLGIEYAGEAWPGSTVPIIRPDPGGAMRIDTGVFGLLPHWLKTKQDAKKSMRRAYNCRSETAASKPTFRAAVKAAHFCALPVATFFEPRYDDDKPVRWRIEPKDGEILFVAGIWSMWTDPEDSVTQLSASMLTLNAEDHPLLNQFHAPTDEKRTVGMLRGKEVEPFLHASPDAALTSLRAWRESELVAAADPLPVRKR